MPEKESRMVESVRNGIVTAIKATGDVAKATVETVTKTLRKTDKDAGKPRVLMVGAAGNVAKAVVHGATDAGAHVGHAAKGAVIGVLRASKHTGEEAIDTVSDTAYALIHGTSEVGGDLGHAATGAIEGAVSVAKEAGVSVNAAAAAAADGALQAADTLGSKALSTVRNATQDTIDDAKGDLKWPSTKHETSETGETHPAKQPAT